MAGIGKTGQDQAFWAGSDTQDSAPFRVEHDGTLVASTATITGAITATSGNIATFSITSGSIDSNTNNAKRGIKIEPGNSIRGYGNTVHSTTCVAGKYSFGVAPVAPPAGGDGVLNSNFGPDGPSGGFTE